LDVLKKLSFTVSKLKILESLSEPKDLSEISESLGKAKQTLIPHLKSLLELGFIEKDDGRYVISKMGEVACKKFSEIVQLLDVFSKLRKFLKEHDVAPIPKNLLNDIQMLYGGEVKVKDNPYEFHRDWLDILLNSSWIYGLSSIYHKDFPDLFTRLSSKKEVKLILTEDVFEKVKKENREELGKFLGRGEMFVCRSVKITFVVAEKGFTMNLYRNSYDSSQILICKTKDAVEWGLRLFKHYLAQSEKVEI